VSSLTLTRRAGQCFGCSAAMVGEEEEDLLEDDIEDLLVELFEALVLQHRRVDREGFVPLGSLPLALPDRTELSMLGLASVVLLGTPLPDKEELAF